MTKKIFSDRLSIVHNAIIQLGDTDDSGKGRHFKSRFIQPGVAGYPGQFGNVLITKETLDKFIKTMVGVPVIINHKDITDKNADDERVGVVNSVWYDNKDGWYWCDGIIWNETAQNLITDKNWSVSCSYNVITADNEGGSENNIKYDMEFLDGVFTHLALVNNPRYERANIVLNSKTEFINVNNEDKWITVHPNGKENTGKHLLIKEGETVQEALQRTYGIDGAKGQQKLFDVSKDRKTKEDFKREAAEKQAKYDEIGKKHEENLKKQAEEKEAKKRDDATKLNEQEFFNKYYDSNSLWELHEYWEQAQKQKEAAEKEEKNKKTVEEIKQDYIDGKISAEEAEKLLPKDTDTTSLAIAKYNKEHGIKDAFEELTEEDNFEKETKTTKKDENRYQKVRDLEDKAYKEFKTMYDNYIDKDGMEGWGGIPASRFDKAKEQFNKKYKDAFDKLESDRFVSFEDFAKRENKQSDKEEKYFGLTQKEHNEFIRDITHFQNRIPAHLDKWLGQGFEVQKNDDRKLDSHEYLFYKKGVGGVGISKQTADTINKYTAEKNKANNNKEQDMALLEELKKLITKVENNKGDDMIYNEKEDKRKLIDEVGGILKGKVDDEIIRTIIKKMEEASYNESEDGAADNKKVKNEDDKDDKEEVKNKKVKNEDEEDKEEDKKEVKEVKEDVKEDVDNKCDNSKVDFFEKMNKIYNSALKPDKSETEYVSRADRLKAGEEYFKV